MPLQIRRGTEAERLGMNIPLAVGELLYITDDRTVYVGDGQTLGGILVTSADTDYTDKRAQDAAALIFTNNTHNNISFVYDQIESTITASIDLADYTDVIKASGFEGSVIGNGSIVLFDYLTNSVFLEDLVASDLSPTVTDTFDIGKDQGNRFRNLYLSGNKIEIGSAEITANGAAIDLPAGSTVNGEPIGSATSGEGVIEGSNYRINIVGDDSTLIIDSSTNQGNFNRINIVDTFSIESGIISAPVNILWEGSLEDPPITVVVNSRSLADSEESTSILTGSPHTFELKSYKGTLDNLLDIESSDVLGGFSLAVSQSNESESFNFLIWQADPNQTTTDSYVPSKFFIVNSGPTAGTFNFVTVDSEGKMGINVENPQATIDINGFAKLAILTAEPANPANGMVAIADGTSWDPLTNGKQSMVVYLGGGWRQIAVEP